MEIVEDSIKKIIIKRYGSLNKFCEKISMPWTTLDSILKRGIANSNITNVMKITKELGIDTESLASGTIVNSKELNISKKLVSTKNLPKIMEYYEALNDTGKHVAEKRIKELTYIPEYITSELDESFFRYFGSVKEAKEYLAEQRAFVAFKNGDEEISDADIMTIANMFFENNNRE